jgi:hypothetical protein
LPSSRKIVQEFSSELILDFRIFQKPFLVIAVVEPSLILNQVWEEIEKWREFNVNDVFLFWKFKIV